MLKTSQEEGEGKTIAKPPVSFWQILNMNFGFFGIQYSFGLQQTNMTPICSYLRANSDTWQESLNNATDENSAGFSQAQLLISQVNGTYYAFPIPDAANTVTGFPAPFFLSDYRK